MIYYRVTGVGHLLGELTISHRMRGNYKPLFANNKSNFIQLHYAEAKVRQNSRSLFSFVCLFSFWLRKVNNLLLKNNKNLKTNLADKYFTKLSNGARFGQEIASVLIYILYTITIHKSSRRRFDKSEFFPHKNKHFYNFALFGVY